ncbi:hypothetical protein GMO_14080 [Gluconobacter morbifer G707]|uniref:Uncharacterized protein n=1 Tax=Gluconobacter morbifer G707 TaxID=1088869 RepID=G6XIJ8_9PROT|nr:hypothetical protein GMO_14080 [Gluconobacter morbifer G707]
MAGGAHFMNIFFSVIVSPDVVRGLQLDRKTPDAELDLA